MKPTQEELVPSTPEERAPSEETEAIISEVKEEKPQEETPQMRKEAVLTEIGSRLDVVDRELASDPSREAELRVERKKILDEFAAAENASYAEQAVEQPIQSTTEDIEAPQPTAEESRETRRKEIVKELETEWEKVNGPMERPLTQREIAKNKEKAAFEGKEWDGSTTILTDKANEFYFDHRGMSERSVPARADRILAERFPEYASPRKEVISETNNKTPEAVDRPFVETQEDPTSLQENTVEPENPVEVKEAINVEQHIQQFLTMEQTAEILSKERDGERMEVFKKVEQRFEKEKEEVIPEVVAEALVKENESILDTFEEIDKKEEDFDEVEIALGEYEEAIKKQDPDFESEREQRSVANLMKKHNAFFFHGIETSVPEIHEKLGVINPETTSNDRLDLILAFEPTLSVSTVRWGNKEDGVWGDRGVLLNGGRVQAAAEEDLLTKATGLKSRTSTSGREGVTNSEGIAVAIENDSKAVYNELAVEDPQILGYYYIRDTGPGMFPRKHPRSEIQDAVHATERGLPFFIVDRGEVIPAKIVKEKDHTSSEVKDPQILSEETEEQYLIILENERPPLTPAEAADMPSSALLPMDKSILREELLTDATFNTSVFEERIPELGYIKGIRQAQRALEKLTDLSSDGFIKAGYIEVYTNKGSFDFLNLVSGLEKMFSAEDGKELQEIAAFCYEFADTYEKESGANNETKKLRELAGGVISYNEFQQIKNKRLDEKGRFKYSIEEVA